MGDFIRKAFKLSGMDEKMEKVIEETILHEWNDDLGFKCPKPAVPQNIDSSKNTPSLGMVRLVTERIMRRMERKYENKLQKYKNEEEKKIEEKMEKLKIEYKNNLEFMHSQHEEEMRKKEDDFRRREELLKEENNLVFEKQHLELERAWSEVEASKKDIRVEKEHLEAAKANFSLKIRNTNLNFQRQKDELAKESIMLEDREKELEEKIRIAVADAKQKERDWIVAKVKEWNAKEAKLTEKCEALYQKIRKSSELRTTVNEQASTIRVLEGDVACLREKLNEVETKFKEAQHTLRKFSDYEVIQEENKRLKEELLSKSKDDIILSKDTELANLKRRLKLVEETANLRIKELKLKLKIFNERRQETMIASKDRQFHDILKSSGSKKKAYQPLFNDANFFSPLRYESNTSPSASSSSSDRTVRDRLKSIEKISRKLDVSVAQYQSRHLSNDYTPVFSGNIILPTKRITSAAPQPLMTSTPKSKKKFSLKLSNIESANEETSVIHSNGEPVVKSLEGFGKTTHNEIAERAENSSRRHFNFGNRFSENKTSKSNIQEMDKSVEQILEPKDHNDYAQNTGEAEKPDSLPKNESSDNERLEALGLDPVESDEARTDSEW